MKRRPGVLFLLSILLLTSHAAHSQVKIENLYFNSTQNILRLDFGSVPPTPIYTGIAALSNNTAEPNVGEGIAHAEDAQGNIIIWVNSNGVYDKNGILMPGSVGIQADASSTEIVLCPFPAVPDRYYMFYNDQKCSALYHAVIDMKQRGGLGDVIQKNTAIDSPNLFAEGLEIIKIPCTRDYWLVSYQCYTGFKRFRISVNGVENGILVQPYNAGNHQGRGELDYHNGRIGYAVTYRNRAFLADFNPVTGTFANGRDVAFPATNGMYGLEFSPDGSKAYLTDWYNLDFFGNITSPNLFRYDFVSRAVQSWRIPFNVSTYPDANTEGLGQIEMGRNGRLYSPFVKGRHILVVNNPNETVLSFGTLAVNTQLSTGVSDHIQSDVFQPVALTASRSEICQGESVVLTAEGGSAPYRWSGDGGTAGSISVTPSATTTYRVYTRNQYACDDSASVTVRVKNTKPILSAAQQNSGCFRSSQVLRATPGLGTYRWLLDGRPLATPSNDTLTATASGTYKVVVQTLGCTAESNEITVRVAPATELFVPNVFTPDNDEKKTNETFEIRGYTGIIRLTVCNRWGQVVFHRDDYQNDWRAENLGNGFYFYYLQHADNCFAPVKGWVSVLRGKVE